jgi:hypothetical protein
MTTHKSERFQSALAELKDCFRHLHDHDLSHDEGIARDDLACWCKLTFDDWSDYLPKNYGVDVGEVIDE